ncbi:hypothetical protein M2119_000040 [Aurantimicrobium minutum]|uniref:hypothetical protein n=1 Tax=Aurantimicrobium minutum TaxID=708131 RepID=UPI0024742EDD|nr:hypothetical protein [Aurantimicrobium minutum]MDH6531803.1 hypothetical protein [Aurantimicrobium minutum]
MNPQVVDPTFKIGRLQKAREFAETAAVLFDDATRNSDHGDVYVTMAIHSGIASSDVICATKLGEYSAADSHAAAVALLKKADSTAASLLSKLLNMKTKSAYGHRAVNGSEVRTAESAHKKLLALAEQV